ncbi:hypothetical protein ACIQLJ_04000 [Microbacterium sp. NPDC091313]
MTKLPRAIVALTIATLATATLALTACAPATPDAAPSPTPSLEATAPSPSADALPTGKDITTWAASALPEDRPGGAAPVLSSSGAVSPAQPAALEISQNEGLWDLLLTCQSADGSPVQWVIDSPTSAIDTPTEQTCPSPTGGTPSSAIIGFDGPDAVLRITATGDAVYAIQVRPHDDDSD